MLKNFKKDFKDIDIQCNLQHEEEEESLSSNDSFNISFDSN